MRFQFFLYHMFQSLLKICIWDVIKRVISIKFTLWRWEFVYLLENVWIYPKWLGMMSFRVIRTAFAFVIFINLLVVAISFFSICLWFNSIFQILSVILILKLIFHFNYVFALNIKATHEKHSSNYQLCMSIYKKKTGKYT